ncbi:MAG: hypothetical protein H8F28_11165 [Fibrella sp.]|nr:hypothetical protein [Armatimonadota bacterium]
MPSINLVRACVLAAVTFCGMSPAFAQATTYTARDAGAPNLGVNRANVPNSDAARNLFVAAIGVAPTIEDFESATPGAYTTFAGNGYDIDFGANVLLTQPNILDNTGGLGNATGGFNTTTGGAKRLRSNPGNDTAQPVVITFTFDVPQRFFGAYISGLGTSPSQGNIALGFNEANASSFVLNPSDRTGGVQFFGLIAEQGQTFTTATFTFSPPSDELFVVDDVFYSLTPPVVVPELPTGGYALLSGALMIGVALRKRQ